MEKKQLYEKVDGIELPKSGADIIKKSPKRKPQEIERDIERSR